MKLLLLSIIFKNFLICKIWWYEMVFKKPSLYLMFICSPLINKTTQHDKLSIIQFFLCFVLSYRCTFWLSQKEPINHRKQNFVVTFSVNKHLRVNQIMANCYVHNFVSRFDKTNLFCCLQNVFANTIFVPVLKHVCLFLMIECHDYVYN